MDGKWTFSGYRETMKFGVLKAIGHNLADSMTCGMGFMIGLYQMDIYGEAAASAEGFIEVDLLTGQTTGGAPSESLSRALKLYSAEAPPQLCEKHGISPSAFRELRVRFWRMALSGRFEVKVTDANGRSDSTQYVGLPASRVKVLDQLGRIRPK